MNGTHTTDTHGAALAALATSGVPVNGDRPSRYASLNVKRPRRSTNPHRNAQGGLTIVAKRACNGCGFTLGDVTDAEVDAAVAGLPLPDVRGECPRCAGERP